MSDRSSRPDRSGDERPVRRVERPAGPPADTDLPDERVAPEPAARLDDTGFTGEYPAPRVPRRRTDEPEFAEEWPAPLYRDEVRPTRALPRIEEDEPLVPRRDSARPVQIASGQDDDEVQVYDHNGRKSYVVEIVYVGDGLNNEDLIPVVDDRGSVMSFVVADVAPNFSDLAKGVDTDGYPVLRYVESRRSTSRSDTRRRPADQAPRPRTSQQPADNRRLLVGVFVVLLALIAGPLLWMAVNTIFGLTGWASFGMGALFTVLTTFGAALFVTRPNNHSHSSGRRR